ncbi:hypothetical protein MUK42_30556 [Musa troglodytarum]|uniref:non-specific serine/threonine protein kinase n=1 Tax=Musa troglodytarum TaxID=320322 RepID=A0A9E7FRV5_9LILI|nr:hypothetical protein MUK42_30556 [Musa troglodytarum]
MVLGPEEAKLAAWEGSKEGFGKNKRRKKTRGGGNNSTKGEETTGCWMKFRLMGGCVPSRAKVDNSIGSATTHCESKSTNDGSRDQPVAPLASGSTTSSNAESNSSASKVGEELKVSSQLRKFTFSDLKSATRNFRPESLLGEGGFGCVFKGWIEENGTAPVKPGTGLTVAVKTLNHDGLQGHREWLAEVNYLGELQHPNLVKLIGYCIEDDQRLLVYEFMPRGSLENHLFRRALPLPWSIRMKIALGAAKGLAFLHEEAERPVIYRDFKSSNVLLDVDYNAKLSDFGLAKDAPDGDKTHVSTRVMGTYGYAAPEYVMTGHLTSKSDVYSYGVVLLEMMTGRRSMDKNRPNGEHNLVEWARPHLKERRRFYRLIDPRLEGNFSIKGAQKASQLAHACLSRDPKARPLMSEVVEVLKPLINLKDMASSSYFFQTMQTERTMAHSNSVGARNGMKPQGSFGRNGQPPMRSLSHGWQLVTPRAVVVLSVASALRIISMNSSRGRPRQMVEYDLQPPTQWIETAHNHILRMHLPAIASRCFTISLFGSAFPCALTIQISDTSFCMETQGFRTDEIKVQVDDNSGKLMVRGRRPLGEAMVARVEQDFHVPKDADTEKVHAKFEQGWLSLVMPKKPKQESESTQLAVSYEDTKKEEEPVLQEKPETGKTEKEAAPVPKEMPRSGHEKPTTEGDRAKERRSPRRKPVGGDRKEEDNYRRRESAPVSYPTQKPEGCGRKEEEDDRLEKAKSPKAKAEEAFRRGEDPKIGRKKDRGVTWKNRFEEMEEWLDNATVDRLVESFNKNRNVIAAAAVGFFVGFYVAQKLRSSSR